MDKNKEFIELCIGLATKENYIIGCFRIQKDIKKRLKEFKVKG